MLLLLSATFSSPSSHILPLVSASPLQTPHRIQGTLADVYSQLVPDPALLCLVLSIHGNIIIVPQCKREIQ